MPGTKTSTSSVGGGVHDGADRIDAHHGRGVDDVDPARRGSAPRWPSGRRWPARSRPGRACRRALVSPTLVLPDSTGFTGPHLSSVMVTLLSGVLPGLVASIGRRDRGRRGQVAAHLGGAVHLGQRDRRRVVERVPQRAGDDLLADRVEGERRVGAAGELAGTTRALPFGVLELAPEVVGRRSPGDEVGLQRLGRPAPSSRSPPDRAPTGTARTRCRRWSASIDAPEAPVGSTQSNVPPGTVGVTVTFQPGAG